MKVGVTPQSPQLPPPDVAGGKEFTLHWGAVQPGQEKEGQIGVGWEQKREMERDEWGGRERLRLKQRPRETETETEGEKDKQKQRWRKIQREGDTDTQIEKDRDPQRVQEKLKETELWGGGEKERSGQGGKRGEKREGRRGREKGRDRQGEVSWSLREEGLLEMATWASEKSVGTGSNAAHSR